MEKFLWNAGGIVLFLMNIWCLMFSIVLSTPMSVLAVIVVGFADWLYKEKRPTWIEV